MATKMMDDRKYKILLIEDDKLDQMAFKRLVKEKELSYDYTIAGSVSEAQSILGSERFDVVIADYSLGDGTAFDVLGLVKDAPTILVTGAGDEGIAIKAWRTGAYDYLIKDHERNYLKALPITVENAIERKKMKETLDRKQKNLGAIFDAVPVGMLLVDENMIVKRVNDATKQLVRREYLQIINQRVGNALRCVNSTYNEKGCGYGPVCAACPLRKTIKSVLDLEESVREVEIRPTLKVDDKEITPWLRISAEPAIIDGCKHVVVAFVDITERKRAEWKLKQTMEIKSQFISTVSHELRTPLTNMKESIGIILDGLAGEINDEQRNFLDIAKRNVDRLARFINDVLDFQKLSSGKILFNIQEHDITETVEETHRVMVALAKNEEVALSIKLEDNLPRASFDRDKIIQVLMNLISNAIKFTPKEGKVSVTVQCQGEELVIRVSDTGVGIPREALPKIFERFYCVHRPGKQIQGTGLGLAIVKKIIMAHGGRIEVESEVDQGTTFSVFLPLAPKSMPEVPSEKMDELLEKTVVDDSARTK